MRLMRLIPRGRFLLTAILVVAATAAAWKWWSATRPVYGDGKADVAIEQVFLFAKDPNMVEQTEVLWADKEVWAYCVSRDGKQAAVVNGIEGPPYAGIEYLKKTEDDHSCDYFLFSGNGEHYCYLAAGLSGPNLSKWHVVRDGVPGPQYAEVKQNGIVFSDDGRRLAYTAGSEGKWFVVLDGVPGRPYDEIRDFSPRFSADSSRLAYIARSGDKWRVVVDGTEEPSYDWVEGWCESEDAHGWKGQPINVAGCKPLPYGREWVPFSRDGARLTYIARRGEEWFVVSGSVEGPRYDEIGHLHATPEGAPLSYCARMGDEWFVVAGGKEGKRYDGVKLCDWSDDGKRLAFIAAKGNDNFVVVDGVELPPQSGFYGIHYFVMSPRGRHVLYVSGNHDAPTIFFDGKSLTGAPEDYAYSYVPFFTPDGEHVVCEAYAWMSRVSDLAFGVSNLCQRLFGRRIFSYYPGVDRQATCIDGGIIAKHSYICSSTFTPDGNHIAYVADDGGPSRLYVDGICRAKLKPCASDFKVYQQDTPGVISRVTEKSGGFCLEKIKIKSKVLAPHDGRKRDSSDVEGQRSGESAYDFVAERDAPVSSAQPGVR